MSRRTRRTREQALAIARALRARFITEEAELAARVGLAKISAMSIDPQALAPAAGAAPGGFNLAGALAALAAKSPTTTPLPAPDIEEPRGKRMARELFAKLSEPPAHAHPATETLETLISHIRKREGIGRPPEGQGDTFSLEEQQQAREILQEILKRTKKN